MSLENIGTIEALLRRGSIARTEAAHHGALVMGKSMPVLVILSRESLDVVVTCLNGALLRALILMC